MAERKVGLGDCHWLLQMVIGAAIAEMTTISCMRRAELNSVKDRLDALESASPAGEAAETKEDEQ